MHGIMRIINSTSYLSCSDVFARLPRFNRIADKIIKKKKMAMSSKNDDFV